MIPAVMTDVVRLLKHDRDLVRKKAVMALHRMNQMDPDVRKRCINVNELSEYIYIYICFFFQIKCVSWPQWMGIPLR